MLRLSIAEAARELRLSPTTVYGLCKRRKIRHERCGLGRGRIFIPQDAIEEYRRSCTVSVSEGASLPRRMPAITLKHLGL